MKTLITTAKKMLSLGFIGVGWIGRNRMEAFLAAGHKAALIADPDPDNAYAAQQIAPEAYALEEGDTLNNEPDIDGIVIATPSALHASQSIAALKSGKAVFCQKPLGRTAGEVRAVLRASKKADKLLALDLSYRYTQAFLAVYDVITKGEIGKVYVVNLTFHNAYGPDKAWFYDAAQSGGGCVMDLGIHLLDLAMYCLGFPDIKDVKSTLYRKGQKLSPGGKEIEDYASVTLCTELSTLINLQCSWNISAGQDAVIEATFFGTEGGVSFKNMGGSFYDFKAEKYRGTTSEIMILPPDDWMGKAGVIWADKVIGGAGFDSTTASQYIKVAEIIDRIYGRAN